jgi:hypothetical protein
VPVVIMMAANRLKRRMEVVLRIVKKSFRFKFGKNAFNLNLKQGRLLTGMSYFAITLSMD